MTNHGFPCKCGRHYQTTEALEVCREREAAEKHAAALAAALEDARLQIVALCSADDVPDSVSAALAAYEADR